MLVLANKIYLFHTLDEFKDKKKGEILDLIKYSIPCAIVYIVKIKKYFRDSII